MIEAKLWLVRHGETAWSVSGAHTGKTDIPLTRRGRERALAIRDYLNHRPFSLVLTSPRQRAQETCYIAGYEASAVIDDALSEWDYGAYEGRKTEEIRAEQPDWFLWHHGVPHGETVNAVGVRAKAVIARCLALDGPALLFAHGHIFRILTAVWLNLPPDRGSLFALGTGSVSTLGFERDRRVIVTWNRSFEMNG